MQLSNFFLKGKKGPAHLKYKTPLTRICVTESNPPGRYLGHRTACRPHSLQTQLCEVTQQPASGSASQQ